MTETDRLRAAVTAFLEEEAELLDIPDYRAWLGLFTENARYWIPASPALRDPTEGLSHAIDDRLVLEARVERLAGPGVVPQTPASRTSRLVGHVRLLEPDGTAPIRVRSRFHVIEARVLHEPDDAPRLFAGTAIHNLLPHGDSFRIVSKRIDLIDCDSGFRGVSILL